MLSPIPRSAIYLGKAAGTLLFMCVIEIVLVPLVAVFFQRAAHERLMPHRMRVGMRRRPCLR